MKLNFSEACFVTTAMALSVTVLLEETKPGCLIPGDTQHTLGTKPTCKRRTPEVTDSLKN